MRRADKLTELMDEPDVNRADLEHSLHYIRNVNAKLGGVSAVLGHLKKFAKGWGKSSKENPITILDVATGSADIPEAILKWANARGHQVKIIALDLHPATLAIARQWTLGAGNTEVREKLTFVRGDALQLPLGAGVVDYVICSMFLHHLSVADAQRVVGEMIRVARRGIIVNDLLRNRLAQVFIHVATLRARPIEKHDARVSVAKAWEKHEVLGWRSNLAAPWLRYHRHLFSRFTLYGEKPTFNDRVNNYAAGL